MDRRCEILHLERPGTLTAVDRIDSKAAPGKAEIARVWLIFLASCNPIINKLLHSFFILSPSLRSRVNSAKDLAFEKD